MFGGDLGQLGKDVEFQGGDLGDRLDDEVGGGEVVQGSGRVEEGPGSVGLFLGDSRLGDIFG